MSTNNTSESSPHGSKHMFSGYAYYTIGLSTSILLFFTFIIVILYFCSRRIAMNPTRLSQVRNSSFALRSIITAQDPPHATTNNGQVQSGVDDETLNTYPVLLYSELKSDRRGGSGGDSGATCSICLGDFSESEWLRELPDCGHLFHQKCIDMWLRMNSSCPLCRTSPLPSPVSTPLAEVAPLARSGA